MFARPTTLFDPLQEGWRKYKTRSASCDYSAFRPEASPLRLPLTGCRPKNISLWDGPHASSLVEVSLPFDLQLVMWSHLQRIEREKGAPSFGALKATLVARRKNSCDVRSTSIGFRFFSFLFFFSCARVAVLISLIFFFFLNSENHRNCPLVSPISESGSGDKVHKEAKNARIKRHEICLIF